MLVLYNLRFPADQIFPFGIIASRILLGNKWLVGMQLYFILFAGPHGLGRFRGLLACQNLIQGIALVRVLMGRFFCLTAGQLLGYFIARLPMDMPLRLLLTAGQIAFPVIAFFPVCMAGAFRHAAHQIPGFLITVFGMGMLGLCGLGADQVSPFRCITGFTMGMDFRNCIATVRMPVKFDLRQRTHKTSVFVPAGGVMLVNHNICFHLAGQNPFFPGGYLRIAGFRMGMLRNLAFLFHGDGR